MTTTTNEGVGEDKEDDTDPRPLAGTHTARMATMTKRATHSVVHGDLVTIPQPWARPLRRLRQHPASLAASYSVSCQHPHR